MVEPRHGKVRRIMNSVVAFHKSQQIEPYLQDLVHRLMDEMMAEAAVNGDEGVDVVRRLATPIPPAAMSRLFGFPESDAKEYEKWSRLGGERYEKALAKGESIKMADLNPEQRSYIDQKIQERLALPRDEWPEDAITRFLTTEVDGETLDPRNIRAQIMFMIGAGSDTTKNVIGNLIYRLGLDQEAYAALREDPELVDVAIEESLRMDTPAQFMVRNCRQDTELVGEPVEAGTKVLMCIGSGNHDTSKFEDPDTFRLDRASREHLSFGSGPHICPGATLARLEVRTLMREFTSGSRRSASSTSTTTRCLSACCKVRSPCASSLSPPEAIHLLHPSRSYASRVNGIQSFGSATPNRTIDRITKVARRTAARISYHSTPSALRPVPCSQRSMVC